jgi:non-specific serine/threonine protein kinase
LRATLDWSYHLLAPGEQALFTHLAVFAGRCTLGAADAVCGSHANGEPAVLDGVTSLIDKGLLRAMHDLGGAPCFAMLETIRAYAMQKLEESGGAEDVRRRHAAYYLALVEEAEAAHWGPQQRQWLARLEAEHGNVRAALCWLLDQGEEEPRLRFAAAVWRFWLLHSHLREGSQWLEEVLARSDAASQQRAKVLYGAGLLAYRRGNYAQSRSLHEQGLAIFQAFGDQWGIARSLNQLANVALDADGDAARARALYLASLRCAREIADMWLEATIFNNLSIVALSQGDCAQARTLGEDSLVLRRSLGDAWAIAEVLINLARVALEDGHPRRATALLKESLALLRDVGDRRALADSLGALAVARGLDGHPEQAAQLWAVTDNLLEETGGTLELRAWHERWLAAIRAQVTDATWRSAYSEGHSMNVEQAPTLAEFSNGGVAAAPSPGSPGQYLLGG